VVAEDTVEEDVFLIRGVGDTRDGAGAEERFL
jgi:hypothetical protein